jgi:hypothetical protein
MCYHLVLISEILFALLNSPLSTIDTRVEILWYMRINKEWLPLKSTNLCHTVLHSQMLSSSEIMDLVEVFTIDKFQLPLFCQKPLTQNQITNLLNAVGSGYLPDFVANLHTFWWSWHQDFNVRQHAIGLFDNRDSRISPYFSLLRLVADAKLINIQLVHLAYCSDRLLPFGNVAMQYSLNKVDANISDDDFDTIVNIAHTGKIRVPQLVKFAKLKLQSQSVLTVVRSLEFIEWLGPIASGCMKEVEQLICHPEPDVSKAAQQAFAKIAIKD